jgi:hypothetical protein
MDTIVDKREFNGLPALGGGGRTLQVRIGAIPAKAIAGASHALIAVFDSVWELRQRAYERRLLAAMDARGRGDVGAGQSGLRTDLTDPAIRNYWEKARR